MFDFLKFLFRFFLLTSVQFSRFSFGFLPVPGQTGKHRHHVLNLPGLTGRHRRHVLNLSCLFIHAFVSSSVTKAVTTQRAVLKTS